MKMSQGADHLRLVLKHDTALDLCLFQVIEGAKGAIGDAFIGQWPQAFTGLQFRRIGRQEEQMDAPAAPPVPGWYATQLDRAPAGSASWDLLRPRCRKMGERDGEHLRCHRRQQKPFGLASSRLNKSVDYVSSTLNTMDLQEGLFETDPLAGSLPRFSVPNPHPFREQAFAAGLHKEPVVLPISFNAPDHPLTVEQDLQWAS